jgi:hypothetical protein
LKKGTNWEQLKYKWNYSSIWRFFEPFCDPSIDFKNFNEKTLIELFNSKNLKNLTELVFYVIYYFYNFLNDQILIAISNNLFNLKILSLYSCPQLTDVGIIAIVKNCLKLENF